MADPEVEIVAFEPGDLDAVVALSLRAWAPVFPLMRKEIPAHVYDAFYPDGWQARQRTDIEAICHDAETCVWVARRDGRVVGFVGLRVHEQDSMGEIHVIAVDPAHQRRGIGSLLIEFALGWMRDRKLAIAMIETASDAGHAPARAAYEGAGFALLPVARYFRKL